ncbi:Rec8 like protein-domain-containing protein [Lentinula aciculospora]|uniref:Rec8 like protein-domain-containing protein n=1 Tax=Lentinula aciculospora TaxID=153920 RepID=A0A9W9AM40_9AGAR|nr:Rec8 like protein-domain-containing protein [Lentinula aciculospora]
MFFTPELLARRDSGFGLLWLAATLGSKSTFKKLPKRSVLTADISQLCELIAQPEEPLALRLSSNLMVGVARVYKVKQELFMNDVTNCVSSLKKVVQDIQSTAVQDASLQMQQQTRPSAFTIAADPHAMYLLEFDDFVEDWEEFLNLQDDTKRKQAEDNQEYKATVLKKARQKNTTAKPPPLTEQVRAEMVTLKEHHDHLLSNSFDLSFYGSQRSGFDVSSSQAEPAFAFTENLLTGIDDGIGIDLGLGDDLVRELGEGWGASPVKNVHQDHMDVDEPFDPILFENREIGIGSDFMLGGDDIEVGNQGSGEYPASRFTFVEPQTPIRRKVTKGKENPAPSSQAPPALQPPATPANSFVHLLLSQDEEIRQSESAPLADVTASRQNTGKPLKKTHKRTRLLLDARTELTDDELKIARAQYLSEQYHQRREFINKRLERNSGRVVQDLIWGVPNGIEAPALINFWQDNFKVQVEARTGLIHLDMPDVEEHELPTKRRKVNTTNNDFEGYMQVEDMEQPGFDLITEGEMGRGDERNFFDGGWNNDIDVESRLRSSEEPGQARHISKPPSDIGANFNFDLGSISRQEGSQRSSLFPWDNAGAGASSSVDAFGGGSDRISFDRAEVKIRGSSFSRRESSLIPSQNGSTGIRGISPVDIRIRESQVINEDFVFSGVGPENTQTMNTQTMNTNTQLDSQKSDLNLITLERNSFNFLEYTKMQQQAMPTGSGSISFDVVVPKLTSTRHVAAAAFYHCLVLTTKELLKVHQTDGYEAISLKVLGG